MSESRSANSIAVVMDCSRHSVYLQCVRSHDIGTDWAADWDALLQHACMQYCNLRSPHGRRRVVVQRPEVAVPIHQRRAHGELLGHADQGVVHSSVTVGVELAQHLANDARTLSAQKKQMMGKEHAASVTFGPDRCAPHH